MLKGTFDVDEVNRLIHLLGSHGIAYLMGTMPASEEEVVSPVRLLQRLASCHYPLVECACIALLLLHPEFASAVKTALQESEPEVTENLAVLTLATLYMQQWWFFRLAFAFGRLPDFPEEPFVALWEDRHLPPPSAGYGRTGFLELQDYQQQRYGLPLNFIADWQNQINHLLAQEEAHQRPLSDELINTLRQKSILGACSI